MAASILDEFRARSEASSDSWNYIVGALGFQVATGRDLTSEEVLNILRKAEAFGNERLVRKGVRDTRPSVDAYIDTLR